MVFGSSSWWTELVDSHRRAGESVARIRSFLAWPLHLNLAAEERAQFRQIARFERIPPPADLGIDPTVFLPPDSAEHRYVWARCLSRMRETMNREIDARVCLGGQVTGYKGKYPGLVEEALMALQAGKPLYLIGALGGCARALIEAVGEASVDCKGLFHHKARDFSRKLFTLKLSIFTTYL